MHPVPGHLLQAVCVHPDSSDCTRQRLSYTVPGHLATIEFVLTRTVYHYERQARGSWFRSLGWTGYVSVTMATGTVDDACTFTGHAFLDCPSTWDDIRKATQISAEFLQDLMQIVQRFLTRLGKGTTLAFQNATPPQFIECPPRYNEGVVHH